MALLSSRVLYLNLVVFVTTRTHLAGIAGVATITTVDFIVTNQWLNLAEVWLFYQGIQVNPSSLTFTLSSTYPGLPAELCNDGNINTICHSLQDPVATLTIQTSAPIPVDEITLVTRQDCCQDRADGATVMAYNGAAMQWQTIVPSYAARWYTFQIGE